jgi:cytochrome c
MMQGPAAPAPGGKAAGAAVYRSNFAACHTLRAGGGSKIGPNLHGLFGRWAGRLPGYRYSAAMVRSGVTWDNKTLDAFLANPHRFIPGDNMAFQAIPDSEQRQALITFLQSATRW